MPILTTYTKQPAEVLDYDVDFSSWIPAGDAIISATATVSPSGLTVGAPIIFAAENYVKVWVSSGTSGNTYKVEITATTDDGRVNQVELKFVVKED